MADDDGRAVLAEVAGEDDLPSGRCYDGITDGPGIVNPAMPAERTRSDAFSSRRNRSHLYEPGAKGGARQPMIGSYRASRQPMHLLHRPTQQARLRPQFESAMPSSFSVSVRIIPSKLPTEGLRGDFARLPPIAQPSPPATRHHDYRRNWRAIADRASLPVLSRLCRATTHFSLDA